MEKKSHSKCTVCFLYQKALGPSLGSPVTLILGTILTSYFFFLINESTSKAIIRKRWDTVKRRNTRTSKQINDYNELLKKVPKKDGSWDQRSSNHSPQVKFNSCLFSDKVLMEISYACSLCIIYSCVHRATGRAEGQQERLHCLKNLEY